MENSEQKFEELKEFFKNSELHVKEETVGKDKANGFSVFLGTKFLFSFTYFTDEAHKSVWLSVANRAFILERGE